MTSFEVTFDGGQELLNLLKTAGDQSGHVVGQAVYEEALTIFAKSQTLVPVDTGALRGSGNVSAITEFPEGMGVEIYYGGPAAPYALLVHEIMGNYHLYPTQAKYLEQPFMEQLPHIQRNLGLRIMRIIRDMAVQ